METKRSCTLIISFSYYLTCNQITSIHKSFLLLSSPFPRWAWNKFVVLFLVMFCFHTLNFYFFLWLRISKGMRFSSAKIGIFLVRYFRWVNVQIWNIILWCRLFSFFKNLFVSDGMIIMIHLRQILIHFLVHCFLLIIIHWLLQRFFNWRNRMRSHEEFFLQLVRLTVHCALERFRF